MSEICVYQAMFMLTSSKITQLQ